MNKLSGAELIAEERKRQIEVEGWSAAHDQFHGDAQLVKAAISYAMAGMGLTASAKETWWPWDEKWWKPKDKLRNLVRAGALIAAEIDRLERDK